MAGPLGALAAIRRSRVRPRRWPGLSQSPPSFPSGPQDPPDCPLAHTSRRPRLLWPAGPTAMMAQGRSPLPEDRPVNHLDRVAGEWRARADELADWVMTHLVNRTDVWGRYVRNKSEATTRAVTAPFAAERGKVSLDH